MDKYLFKYGINALFERLFRNVSDIFSFEMSISEGIIAWYAF